MRELGLPVTVLSPSGEEPAPGSGEQAALYALRAARAKACSVLEHIPSPLDSLLPAPGPKPDQPKTPGRTTAPGSAKAPGVTGATGAVIIAADTVVLLEGRIYGKPRDHAEALSMLRDLAGRTHSVITGCALLQLPARFAAQPASRSSAPASSLNLKDAARSAASASPASVVVPEAMEAAAFAVKSRVSIWQAPDALLQAYAASGEALDKAGGYAVQGAGACLVQAVEGSWTNVVGLPLAELMLHLLRLGAVRPAPPAR